MITAKQREDAFRADLKALLEKHGAELDVTDDHEPYGQHQGICVISMLQVYDGNKCLKQYCEFNL